MASIRNGSNRKVSLKHTQPVQCLFSCLHVQLLWFCRSISLNKSDMQDNIDTLAYSHFEGEKWVGFFVLGLDALQILITQVLK